MSVQCVCERGRCIVAVFNVVLASLQSFVIVTCRRSCADPGGGHGGLGPPPPSPQNIAPPNSEARAKRALAPPPGGQGGLGPPPYKILDPPM